MTKLVERALVKDLLQIARADTVQDGVLGTFIEQASEETERLTRRQFQKKERTEYNTSYEQAAADIDPQIILLDAYPIDPSAPLIMSWSPYDHADDLFVGLSKAAGDFTVEEEKGKIVVRRMGSMATNLPVIGGFNFTYAERGFKTVYTGGYDITVKPDPDPNADPLDDYGVIQVPMALKLIVAKKVISDYRDLRGMRDPKAPVVDAQEQLRRDLKPWTKKDMI